MSVFTAKSTLSLTRSLFIISLLGLSINILCAFQDKSVKKTKYEFSDTRVSEADSLLAIRQYQAALEAYEKTYELYDSEAFYEGMVYVLDRIAFSYRRLGKNEKSSRKFEEASQLAKRHLPNGNMLISKVYVDNAIRAHFKNDWTEASHLIDSGKWAYDKSSFYDSALVKNIIDFKFYTYYYSGLGNDTLIKYLNERSRLFEATGSALHQSIYLLTDYNRAYYRIGDFEKSVAYGLEAVRQSEAGGELVLPFYYTDALFHLGDHYTHKRNMKGLLRLQIS